MTLHKPKRTGDRRFARRSLWRLNNGGTITLTTKYSGRMPVKRTLMITDAKGNQVEAYIGYDDFKLLIGHLDEELEWQQSEEQEDGAKPLRSIRRRR